MKVAVFSTKPYDRTFFLAANQGAGHELVFFEPRLTSQTCPLASGFPAICAFVNDHLDAHVLLTLSRQGTRLVALRCAGFNHVDMEVADQLDLTVTRVPAYSPHAVAEHTVALILALNRHLHKAYNRVREGNFSLGLDVYEEESDLFFEDLSNRLIQDDVFSRMLTFPNVIITGHQGFFTHHAMESIAEETLANITAFEQGLAPPGLVKAELVKA